MEFTSEEVNDFFYEKSKKWVEETRRKIQRRMVPKYDKYNKKYYTFKEKYNVLDKEVVFVEIINMVRHANYKYVPLYDIDLDENDFDMEYVSDMEEEEEEEDVVIDDDGYHIDVPRIMLEPKILENNEVVEVPDTNFWGYYLFSMKEYGVDVFHTDEIYVPNEKIRMESLEEEEEEEEELFDIYKFFHNIRY